jgi:hypothetical protein
MPLPEHEHEPIEPIEPIEPTERELLVQQEVEKFEERWDQIASYLVNSNIKRGELVIYAAAAYDKYSQHLDSRQDGLGEYRQEAMEILVRENKLDGKLAEYLLTPHSDDNPPGRDVLESAVNHSEIRDTDIAKNIIINFFERQISEVARERENREDEQKQPEPQEPEIHHDGDREEREDGEPPEPQEPFEPFEPPELPEPHEPEGL